MRFRPAIEDLCIPMNKITYLIIALAVTAASGTAAFFLTRPFVPAAPSVSEPQPSDEQVTDAPAVIASSIRSAFESEGWNLNVDRDVPSDALPVAGDLGGTGRMHEYMAVKSDTMIEPVITVFRITDRAALTRDVATLSDRARRFGMRDGYLLDIPGSVPSSAFVVIGKTQLVFIAYGLRGTGNLMPWSSDDPAPELTALISRLPLE